MNVVALSGRPTADPSTRSNNDTTVTKGTLAVNRDREHTDFINFVAFGKTAEMIEKYVTKGKLVGITGHIQTGSYTNKDGQKVYTTEVVVDRIDFFQAKDKEEQPKPSTDNSFMDIPDGFEAELPFN